jgi:hypothetical protein
MALFHHKNGFIAITVQEKGKATLESVWPFGGVGDIPELMSPTLRRNRSAIVPSNSMDGVVVMPPLRASRRNR